MDKVYDHKKVEEKIYSDWEKLEYFKPEVNPKGTPYSIILPPPNANAPLHFGHAMYVIEDILIRYHRMRGYAALWLPGADHAGFETQFVFEKHLANEGKSRFDYDRETLYNMIWEFVESNRPVMEGQLRKLGFSLDWSRNKFTLDPDIVAIVYKTFKKLYDDGLVYRAKRLVNYCTFDGTSFSDLEVIYEEKKSPFYLIKYGPFTIGTVRPETKFRDTALAVNPNDSRYKKYIGETFEIMGLLGPVKMKIIPDPDVDPDFGTGIMKVTPAHDPHDFELGKKFDLPVTPIIGFDGKMDFSWFLSRKNVAEKYRRRAEKYNGKYVKQVRNLMIEDFKEDGLLVDVDENYKNRIALCYKCKNPIEPLPMEQWFVKMESLAREAIEAARSGKIKLFPKNFEKIYFQFLENIKDWNISRQIVWGIRIPAWQCTECTTNNYKGWIVTSGDKPEKCPNCGSKNLEQDPDTFDTWFSSAQWPFATLMSGPKSNIKNQKSKTLQGELSDFEKFYPTSVMETGYDILRWWVARMVMVGLYVTKNIPFENVVLHGLVKDPYGKKMSKSKGNVVNPLELVDQYGADAVRFALFYGTALGNDQALSYAKLESARRFTNKLWNIARFIKMNQESRIMNHEDNLNKLKTLADNPIDQEWIERTKQLSNQVTKHLDNYQFNLAAERLYEFIWHEFADKYIEDVKNRIDENSFVILNSLFLIQLKLLHPFMPFVSEELYKQLGYEGKMLIIEQWPDVYFGM